MRNKVIPGVIAGLLALLFGVAWIFSSMLLFPPPYRCRVRVVVYCGTPAQQGLPFEEVRFRANDGLRLSGWWIPSKGATRAVVLSHGRGGTRVGPIRFAKALHSAGFSVLAFDYRNAGKSQKSFNSMGYFERRDLKAAVDFVFHKKRVKKVGVYGLSMGGATTLLTMAEDPRISAALIEGAFSDPAQVIAETARRRYGLGRFPLVDLALWLYQRRGGFSLNAIDPRKAIQKISPRPVEIWHGTRDRVVPPHHGKRLFQAAHAPKALWMVKGARHVRVWNLKPKESTARMVRFFQKALAQKGARNTRPAPTGRPVKR